jgi:hypothetical protein
MTHDILFATNEFRGAVHAAKPMRVLMVHWDGPLGAYLPRARPREGLKTGGGQRRLTSRGRLLPRCR